MQTQQGEGFAAFSVRSYVHSSRDTFALSKLMSSLNDPLLEELKLHLYKGLVSKAKFFKAGILLFPLASSRYYAYYCIYWRHEVYWGVSF